MIFLLWEKDVLGGGFGGVVINKKGKQPNLLEFGCHCQVWGLLYDGMGC